MAGVRRHDGTEKNMITEELHRLGYMTVYPIVACPSTMAMFNGTPDVCDTYVSILLEGHPQMKGIIIITNI